jgi:hypothetical protein
MKLAHFAAVLLVAAPAVAQDLPTRPRGRYEYEKNQLRDPDFFNRSVEACAKEPATQENLESLSKFMHVPVSRVKVEFCRRTFNAYASGKVPYEDYLTYQATHRLPPAIVKALMGR